MIPALSLAFSLSYAAPLPDDSLYLLDAKFVDQRDTQVELGTFRGKPVLLAMFYATCPSACPRLIADVQRVLAQLDEKDRRDVRVVLVSLDPARDTPAVLAKVIEQRSLDPERTTLLAGSDATTRKLAALLGVKYREDGKGAIDHSSRIAVLDRNGRLVAKRDGLGGDVETTVVAVTDALARR
jgi:protein SCO1/2